MDSNEGQTNNLMCCDDLLSTDEVRGIYTAGDAAHDFDHVLRVVGLADRIAMAEGADRSVVRLAALLHDVPVEHVAPDLARGGRHAHHLDAARYAADLLTRRGAGTTCVAQIVHAIEAHRFREQSIRPQSLEAMCLYDADKLDSMGAIGVARCFAYAGAHNNRLWSVPWRDVPAPSAKPAGREYTPVHEFVYKLGQLQSTLCTATGRQLGAGRHRTMLQFFDQLDSELAAGLDAGAGRNEKS